MAREQRARYETVVATEASVIGRWHPRLIEAAKALNEGRYDIAERLLKPHLMEDPFDVRAIRMLAELAARLGRLRDSETLLRRALEIDPHYCDVAVGRWQAMTGKEARHAETGLTFAETAALRSTTDTDAED